MSGRTVRPANQKHRCDLPNNGTYGDIWECGECTRWWRCGWPNDYGEHVWWKVGVLRRWWLQNVRRAVK